MPNYRGLIMSEDKEQWYTNKDLHTQITPLRDLGHENKNNSYNY
ncbi:hypothetical protein [Virgibacillus proomii]|jgi:hypothetical protein|nr:hypothetical protein [Virgibacillus proomii]